MFEHDCLYTSCFGVLYACVSYFCNCTCSAQLTMFHVERRYRNTLIIIINLRTSTSHVLRVCGAEIAVFFV